MEKQKVWDWDEYVMEHYPKELDELTKWTESGDYYLEVPDAVRVAVEHRRHYLKQEIRKVMEDKKLSL